MLKKGTGPMTMQVSGVSHVNEQEFPHEGMGALIMLVGFLPVVCVCVCVRARIGGWGISLLVNPLPLSGHEEAPLWTDRRRNRSRPHQEEERRAHCSAGKEDD